METSTALNIFPKYNTDQKHYVGGKSYIDQSLNLPYFNNTNYPLAVKNQLEMLEYTDEIKAMLHFHQFVPKEFFTRNQHIRGLLFVHTMGTGKTRLAVAIADYIRTHETRRKIIVLLPKSLEGNFKKNIKDFTKVNDEIINKKYKFVSLNASNMYKQMSNVDKSKSETDFEKRLGNFMDDIIKNNSLDNSLLIVDESHNLFNAITNGSKNGVQLYDLIMRAKNLKLIFLTGTPIINDPFELVPCFNMLRGEIPIDFYGKVSKTKRINRNSVSVDDTTDVVDDTNDTTIDTTDVVDDTNDSDIIGGIVGGSFKREEKSNTTVLFSESYEEFEDYFIDRENKKVKNREKFSNRIYGLTSYYGDLYFPSHVERQGFPKKLPTIVEKVPMSIEQFAAYSIARNSELEEDKQKKGFKGKNARFSASSGGSSTYRVKSRQISNYDIPEYALGPVRGQKSRLKFINKIKLDDLQNTQKYSPKMGKIISNINKHHNQLGMVYSQFVSGEGLAIFAKVLEANGWYDFSNTRDESSGFDIKIPNRKTYAVLSGSILPEERVNIIKQFNSAENKTGSKINILLLSSAVAEGIDLKRIRHVHIMEPFWNYARINQVETRAIRFNSHEDLPSDERNVQVYIYLSDYPTEITKQINKQTINDETVVQLNAIEQTTDVDLYTKSIDNMKIINDFLHVLSETSIDCALHHKTLPEEVKKQIKCKLCSPTDQQLFHPLLTKDMILPSNCIPYGEKKISVKEITLPDTNEKYYYKYDPEFKDISLFLFNKKLQGYTLMPRTYYHYGKLIEKIIEKEGVV